jgi:small subunit ribosomal protein S16
LKYKGVLFHKHLLRGVAKGALTQEVADQKWQEWLDAHKNSVLDHQKKLHKSNADKIAKLLEEETKIKESREAKRAAALAAAEAANAPAVEETPAVEEAPVVEEAPAAESTEAPAE